MFVFATVLAITCLICNYIPDKNSKWFYNFSNKYVHLYKDIKI